MIRRKGQQLFWKFSKILKNNQELFLSALLTKYLINNEDLREIFSAVYPALNKHIFEKISLTTMLPHQGTTT